ncbi:hypothetical protein OAB00_04065, partial [Akkermansiaceae bacterium]|nr:hypothetical protein [Akkermansiaceae bacterium]
ALLDLYTICKHHPIGEKPLTVSFVGDLKHGRTVHSLVKILRLYDGVKINFIAPEEIQIPETYKESGDTTFLSLEEPILTDSDVIYDTRMQKERFEDQADYMKVKDSFIFTVAMVSKMKSDATLMHPLPRVNEIQQRVDPLPQARYFEQALNGVPIRMTLIANALNL